MTEKDRLINQYDFVAGVRREAATPGSRNTDRKHTCGSYSSGSLIIHLSFPYGDPHGQVPPLLAESRSKVSLYYCKSAAVMTLTERISRLLRANSLTRQIQAWMRSDLMPIAFCIESNAAFWHPAPLHATCAQSLEPPGPRHDFDLPGQHRKLDNKNRSHRDSDGKQRLRDPGGEYFVCHVHSPLIKSIER